MNGEMPVIGFLTERLILGYGVDLVVDQQAVGLQHAGFEVFVFAHRISELYSNRPYQKFSFQDDFGLGSDTETVEYRRRALLKLTEYPIDVWVIHTPPFYAWKDSLKGGCLLWEHGTPPGSYHADRRRGFQIEWSRRERYRTVFNSITPSQKLVAISKFIKNSLYEPARGEAVVVYNGADHYPAATEQQTAALRERLGVASDALMLLTVSRIAFDYDDQPYKGVHDLLGWFPIFFEKLPTGAKMVVAGRGEERDAPRLRARGVIPFLNVPLEEMPALYKSADLFVCPSRWEGFNLPLVEAQYQGTPVVALNIGAHPEVLGIDELLATDLDGLRRLTAELCSHRGRLQELGLRCQQAARRFTWKENVRQLIELVMSAHHAWNRGADPLPLLQRCDRRTPKNPAEWLLLSRHIISGYGLAHFLRLVWQKAARNLRPRR